MHWRPLLTAVPPRIPGLMTALELKVPKAARGRIDAIDELKGVAILLIILYHAGGVLVWQNTLHGDIGVDLFVVISGVGLALRSRVATAKRSTQSGRAH